MEEKNNNSNIQQENTEISTNEAKVINNPKSSKKIILIVIIALAVIGLGIGGIFLFSGDNFPLGNSKLESIDLKVDDSIPVGEQKLVKVVFNPESKEEDITWESSDEKIATVSDGNVNAIAPGNVKITATTTSGISRSKTITIYIPASDFSISDNSVDMYVGDTKQLTATITPENATYKNVKWKISNSSVATISNDGLITAKSTGEATITATTDEGLKKQCSIVVKEKPIEFSGYGDKIINNVNIPSGEYVAKITVDSTRHYDVKFYYGSSEYDYELLVNESGKPYSGTTFLKGGSTDAVTNGMFQVEAQGPWTIKVEKLAGTATFPITGNGDMVTGLFEGTGNREVFNIKYNSSRHHAVKIYKYNGSEYDYELLVNDSGKPYDGQVMAPTERGAKYFFVVEGEGDWSISK